MSRIYTCITNGDLENKKGISITYPFFTSMFPPHLLLFVLYNLVSGFCHIEMIAQCGHLVGSP
jgi:hypothetical protein